MKELSFHILDIAQNSIAAGASTIRISVDDDMVNDKFTIIVEDDGKGMDASMIEKVKDPFFTTRTTRKVGLGIPLLLAAAERCEGGLDIRSLPGHGTKITAAFKNSHIDREPLGKIWDTIGILIACNEDTEFIYSHRYNGKSFELNTIELKKILKEVPITSPEVIDWIRGYIEEGINHLHGGAEYENNTGTGGNKEEDSPDHKC